MKTSIPDADGGQLFVFTLVSLFDRRKDSPFPLENIWLVLNWSLVPTNEAAVISALLAREQEARTAASPHITAGQTAITVGASRDFVIPWWRYRKYFRRPTTGEIEDEMRALAPGTSLYQTSWDGDYMENELGEPMTMTDAIGFVTKTENPLIYGDVESVLRIGPTPMRCRDARGLRAPRTFSLSTSMWCCRFSVPTGSISH